MREITPERIRSLSARDKAVYRSLFGGEDTIINEGVNVTRGRDLHLVVDGVLYRMLRVDEMIDILQGLGIPFTIDETTDVEAELWPKVVTALRRIDGR